MPYLHTSFELVWIDLTIWESAEDFNFGFLLTIASEDIEILIGTILYMVF